MNFSLNTPQKENTFFPDLLLYMWKYFIYFTNDVICIVVASNKYLCVCKECQDGARVWKLKACAFSKQKLQQNPKLSKHVRTRFFSLFDCFMNWWNNKFLINFTFKAAQFCLISWWSCLLMQFCIRLFICVNSWIYGFQCKKIALLS